MTKREKRMSRRRRAFLMLVGYLSLALDRLEGKPPGRPTPARKGRIQIVD